MYARVAESLAPVSAPLCRVILLSATVGATNFMPVLSLTALDRGFFVSSAKCNR